METKQDGIKLAIRIVLTVLIGMLCPPLVLGSLLLLMSDYAFLAFLPLLVPALIPLLWLERKKGYLIAYCVAVAVCVAVCGIQGGVKLYEESITIDVAPNINVDEYLPFIEDSKIVKYDSKTLKLTEDLPVIDGASAAFPVYSAFVNAVYPETTRLYDGVFEYNNTVGGYRALARKEIDIFIGAQPSAKQVAVAQDHGTTFQYTRIGSEAFVFFVHKDNPVDSLTAEQIRGIYAGEITNWSEVGGSDEPIAAFQRNEGSGSQSMMLRFMGDTPLMEPEGTVIHAMGGIIREVADYKSKSGSIGYSFRYYVEGIIQNPDIKMIAVDGVAPTVANIKNNTYPIVTPVYAVTYADNLNENVGRLIDWMLSEEGQYIIEATGYVGVGDAK